MSVMGNIDMELREPTLPRVDRQFVGQPDVSVRGFEYTSYKTDCMIFVVCHGPMSGQMFDLIDFEPCQP